MLEWPSDPGTIRCRDESGLCSFHLVLPSAASYLQERSLNIWQSYVRVTGVITCVCYQIVWCLDSLVSVYSSQHNSLYIWSPGIFWSHQQHVYGMMSRDDDHGAQLRLTLGDQHVGGGQLLVDFLSCMTSKFILEKDLAALVPDCQSVAPGGVISTLTRWSCQELIFN